MRGKDRFTRLGFSRFKAKFPNYYSDWVEFVKNYCKQCLHCICDQKLTLQGQIPYPQKCNGWSDKHKYQRIHPILKMLVCWRIQCIHFLSKEKNEPPNIKVELKSGFDLIL